MDVSLCVWGRNPYIGEPATVHLRGLSAGEETFSLSNRTFSGTEKSSRGVCIELNDTNLKTLGLRVSCDIGGMGHVQTNEFDLLTPHVAAGGFPESHEQMFTVSVGKKEEMREFSFVVAMRSSVTGGGLLRGLATDGVMGVSDESLNTLTRMRKIESDAFTRVDGVVGSPCAYRPPSLCNRPKQSLPHLLFIAACTYRCDTLEFFESALDHVIALDEHHTPFCESQFRWYFIRLITLSCMAHVYTPDRARGSADTTQSRMNETRNSSDETQSGDCEDLVYSAMQAAASLSVLYTAKDTEMSTRLRQVAQFGNFYRVTTAVGPLLGGDGRWGCHAFLLCLHREYVEPSGQIAGDYVRQPCAIVCDPVSWCPLSGPLTETRMTRPSCVVDAFSRDNTNVRILTLGKEFSSYADTVSYVHYAPRRGAAVSLRVFVREGNANIKATLSDVLTGRASFRAVAELSSVDRVKAPVVAVSRRAQASHPADVGTASTTIIAHDRQKRKTETLTLHVSVTALVIRLCPYSVSLQPPSVRRSMMSIVPVVSPAAIQVAITPSPPTDIFCLCGSASESSHPFYKLVFSIRAVGDRAKYTHVSPRGKTEILLELLFVGPVSASGAVLRYVRAQYN